MSSGYTIEHCPDVELTKLPNNAVTTYDGHKLQLGTVCYFRFTARAAATEYVVVSDRAIRHQGGYKVLVVGPRGYAAAMDAQDFVKNPEVWWEFWQKRYQSSAKKVEENNGEKVQHQRKSGNKE